MTDGLSTAMTDLWRSIAPVVPQFVAFLLILLIGYVVAKAIVATVIIVVVASAMRAVVRALITGAMGGLA